MGSPNAASLLPHHVVEEILSKLPVKSLLRLQSASKHFNSLISSPNFIANHHQDSKTRPSSIILARGAIFRADNLFNDTSHPPQVEEVNPPDWDVYNDSPIYTRNIVGHANGLFVIKDRANPVFPYDDRFVLWNPATKRFKDIPSPCNAGLGFGYHSGIQDYKFFGIPTAGSNCLHVLSLRCGTWREIQCSSLRLECAWQNYSSSAVVVDGVWYRPIIDCCQDMLGVLSFDLKDDSLAWTDSPIPPGATSYTATLGLYHEKLCLFAADTGIRPLAISCYLQMWAMEEKASWTKISTIDLSFTNIPVDGHLELGPMQGSPVSLQAYWSTCPGMLFRCFLYDPSTNSGREILKGSDEIHPHYEAHKYVESLISPEVIFGSSL